MNIQAGTYKAKLNEYGVVDGEYGKQMKFVFGIEDGPNFIHWGEINGGMGAKITAERMMLLGATPSNIDKATCTESGILNTGKVFEIVLRDYTSPKTGKTSVKLKYINDPDRPKQAKQEFEKNSTDLVGLKGIAAQIVAESGQNKAPPIPKSFDDIPGF